MTEISKIQTKTSWVTLVILCLVIAGALLFFAQGELKETYHALFDQAESTQPLPESVSYGEIKNSSETTNVSATNTPEVSTNTEKLPAEFLLDVPFTTQAPFANWDFPYQEACEEASALTVHFFYEGKTFTKEIADKEILALVDFQNKTFGDYKDTTAQETADIIKEYWKYDRVDVLDDPSVEDIKLHVKSGRPVVIPASGKQLGNPNFRNGGPLYHMFVVTGWDADEFITNDVGTRNGEHYRYSYATIMNAMHDWNGGDVANGAKRVIVVYPNES